MKIAINTHTSGKFERQDIGGRSHLVTSVMIIRGDISMNGILYPNDQIKASFEQLHDLPAPNGHPKINGVHVSASLPTSMNQFNIGGLIRNPRMKGKEVFADFLIDEVVANQSEDGKETIRRIENAEKVGVSTGLSIDDLFYKNGVDDFGIKFNREGRGFNFDHVATLLREKAAGEHAGTELKLNTGDPKDPIFVVNLQANDLTIDDIRDKLNTMIQSADEEVMRWIVDIFPEEHIFIWSETKGRNEQMFQQSYLVSSNDEVSIIDIPVAGIFKKEFKPTLTNEDQEMDKEKIVLAIIGLTTNAFTGNDKDRLMALSESDLVNELAGNTVNATSVEQATEILTANGFDFKAFDNFKTNAEPFEVYQKAEKDRIDGIKTTIIKANADYTDELLSGKSEAELLVINKMVENSKTAKRVGEGLVSATNSEGSDPHEFDM